MLNKKKYFKIKYEKERVLLSETLPYEVPLYFSNKNLCNFLIKSNNDSEFKKLIPNAIKYTLTERQISTTKDKLPYYSTPFNFDIRHKVDHPRKLSIPHPIDQVLVSCFYDEYKGQIQYYGNNSPYSLRKIKRISRLEYHDDSINKLLFKDTDKNEVSTHEYRSSSSYFVYEKFTRVYDFTDSSDYIDKEKYYAHLTRLDISRCFDSIYTHTFAWAILGKSCVKNDLAINKKNFGNKFDSVIRRLNDRETNGIVIGPEFSRIFAEIILQYIDRQVEKKLKQKNLHNNKEYSVCRYIDDYYIFYNTNKEINIVKEILVEELNEFNLHINESKTENYSRPLASKQQIAKVNVRDILNENIEVKITDKSEILTKLDNNNIKLKLKSIIHANNISYDDISGIMLGIISKKTKTLYKHYKKLSVNGQNDLFINKHNRRIVKFVENSIELVFYVYSISPKISNIINISRHISYILDINNISKNRVKQSGVIFEKIYHEIISRIENDADEKYSFTENCYLLSILREIGDDHLIPDIKIKKIIEKALKSNSGYLEIISILIYIKGRKAYKGYYKEIISVANHIINLQKDKSLITNTELLLLIYDLSANRDLNATFLIKLFQQTKEFSTLKRNDILPIIKYIRDNNLSFISWQNLDFRKSLIEKKRLEVY